MSAENMESRGPALPTDGVVSAAGTENREETVQPLPEWKVSGIFSSHMVLQRERPITVWGWSSHIGAKVCGAWEVDAASRVGACSGDGVFGGAGVRGGENGCGAADAPDGVERVSGVVDENGRFELTFAPRFASFEPTQMVISSAYGGDTFTDILVGDVWLIGGQSNAELNLAPCLGDSPEIAATLDESYPIRLFHQTQEGAMACTRFHHVPSRDIIREDWCWKRPGEEAAKTFSAIGYYLARLVQPVIKVPMGMVMMCAGGACLRELMPLELGHQLGYQEGANVPVAGYYNTLIAPLIGLQFKGQVFFQGESEGIWENMAHSYGEDLAAYVEDERKRFGFDFSFYNIQLSSYREECDDYFKHLYWVRASQFKALSLIPNSQLTVARDLGSLPGEPDFAHSPHKYELTRRLAAQVLAADYGVGDLKASYSPLPVRAVCDGAGVTVGFDCVNGGLRAAKGCDGRWRTAAAVSGADLGAAGDCACGQSDGAVRGFSFMNADGKEIPAAARILSETEVFVEIPAGADVSWVHYAMNNMAYLEQANLCGGSGLPVPAFAIGCEQR